MRVLDKNEYNSKLQEIDRCVDQGNYAEAARIADQIDWKRVRNIRTLCLISEIYEAEHRYEDSKTLLIRAYKRAPVGRAILYRLVEVTIKLKQFDEAINYYSEYVQAAPHDTSRYILKYKIYRGRGSALNEQIDILKEYLSEEYNEKYAYELARLYQEADRIAECLETCDDLVLWFHSGKYVIKALELKQRYAALTPKQQEIYDHRFDEEELLDEEEIGQEKKMVSSEDTSLAEAIVEDTTREIADEVARASEEDQAADGENKEVQAGETGGEAPGTDAEAGRDRAEGVPDADVSPDTGVESESDQGGEDALDEPVRDAVAFDEQLNKYNTQELQTEMIKSMREIVSGVGIRDLIDVDQEAIDRVIDESKHDQEALAEQDVRQIRMSRKLTLPELQKKKDAGQLSIDDVLLSMGDKGVAVREAVSSIPDPSRPQPAGVLSAVDEALLNMGVRTEKPEPAPEEAKAAAEKPEEPAETVSEEAGSAVPDAVEVAAEEVQEAVEEAAEAVPDAVEEAADEVRDTVEEAADEVPDAGDIADEVEKALAIQAEQAVADAQKEADNAAEVNRAADEKVEAAGGAATEEAEREDRAAEETDSHGVRIMAEIPHGRASAAGDAGQNISMEEIMGARTRKVPTDEIAQKHQSAPLDDELQGADGSPESAAQAAGQPEGRPDERNAAGQDQAAPARNTENAKSAERPAGGPRRPAGMEKKWLKPELRGFFRGYLHVRNMDKQIAGAIEQVMAKGGDKTSRTGNILIFGGHGCGKTTIATGLAKAIAQEKGSRFVKMAKIYAADLNRKDIAATIAKIAGGVMIVEEAGDLEDSVADQLTTAMEFRTDGMILILEDEQRYMHDLLMRHPRLTMKFTSQIYIPAFTIDELVEFGRIYALDHDYSISDEGCIVLAKKLDGQVQQGELMSITTVLDHVDNAMSRANRFSRKLFSGKKRFDSEGRIILLDKDFR